ncbi:hypothetical protein ACTFIY_001237 [Dictyostelium cf. discoideum]
MDIDNSIVIRVVFLGDYCVGKTTIGFVFDGKKFDSYNCNIGVDFFVKPIVVDNQCVRLQVWDTGGQERFRTITRSYFRGSSCCLLFFSVDNQESFKNFDMWYSLALETNELLNYPVVLVGTKIDLPQEKHVITKKMAEEWCKNQQSKFNLNFSIPYFETSAKNNININEIFYSAAELGLKNILFKNNNNNNNNKNNNNNNKNNNNNNNNNNKNNNKLNGNKEIQNETNKGMFDHLAVSFILKFISLKAKSSPMVETSTPNLPYSSQFKKLYNGGI